MITEKRHKLILNELKKKGRLTVLDLVDITKASESTIRRDLVDLDSQGLLKRIHGGAMMIKKTNFVIENPLSIRQLESLEEKDIIGKYASQFIDENDIVYIDAGSTTLKMVDYLTEKKATYVTNGLLQAQILSQKGFRVICLGGEVRGVTGACVGARAYQDLSRYHFTKGFFGTNGVDILNGLTTPDNEEALIKEMAFLHCQSKYVLCDASKFNNISSIHFGDIEEATIITNICEDQQIKEYTTILEVDKL